MSHAALALVLAAAGAHAAWNLIAKRVGSGPAFAWLFGATSAALLVPLAAAALALGAGPVSAAGLAFGIGSGALHVAYFLLLTRGYRLGDLSLVYPLARGTGPLVAVLGAIVLLGERPSGLALAGAALVAGGVLSLAAVPGRGAARGGRDAVGVALATGLVIAAYTLWDQHAVTALDMPPLVYLAVNDLAWCTLLAPIALRRRAEVRHLWRRAALPVAVASALSAAAYLLVLFALRIAPVAYVAPARELSMLIGAGLGVRVLDEPNGGRRLAAAAAIVAGVAALAAG